jgi:signal transduction histidine kinase
VVATIGLGFLPQRVLPPLLFTIAVVAGTNVAYGAIARRGLLETRRLLAAQLYVDLGLLIVLLHLSGGIENPLYLLPVFNVLLGGIVLTRRQCFVLAWAGGVVCSAAVWAECERVIPHYTLSIVPHGAHGDFHVAFDPTFVAARVALQIAMMLLTAHFVSRLADQSRANERGLVAAAAEARAEHELLEQALENTRTGLRVLDPGLRPFLVNDQWRRWFPAGSAAESAILAWASTPASPQRRTLGDSSVQRGELTVSEPGASGRTFAVTTAPLHDGSGRSDRVVELVQDVTAEKEGQQRMLKASKLAAVGEVAGKLAHEINNPTAIVSAKGRLLLSDRRAEMSPKVASEVERIVDLADRIAGIAKGLLAYGRQSAAPRMRVDPSLPVRRALSLVEGQAARQGVRIVDDVGATLPAVDASAAELEQVFLNLFLNALDVMPEGGVLAVTAPGGVPLADGTPAVQIVVVDTGPGIPEDVREHVFDPFFTTKEEGRGSGLGLAVCQGIVRSHGGEIEVESTPGHGARFTVRLPVPSATGRDADG